MDKTASKPMPCPFCGEKPKVYNEVYCGCVNQKCDLGANAPAGGIPISIDVWNRRSPSEPQASVREQEPVAWAVTWEGHFTGNLFESKFRANEAMAKMDASHPDYKRTIVPLYAAPVSKEPREAQGNECPDCAAGLHIRNQDEPGGASHE